MNSRVVLNLWLTVMLGLLVVWKSAMRSDAMARLHQEDNKMHKLPNFRDYKAHFPAIIPDLRVFLKVHRRKQAGKIGVGDRHRTSKRKVVLEKGGCRGLHIARDGLYVLDLLNNWSTSVKVWSGLTNDIDVVLERGKAWTQELVAYKTMQIDFRISLRCRMDGEKKDRALIIRRDPFGGVATPNNRNPLLRDMNKELPCHFFRLAKWVFSRDIGALAVIYVQVHKRNNNRLARLLLMHLPKENFRPGNNGDLPANSFVFWVYQNATDSEPVSLSQVDVQQLAFNLNSLANVSGNANNQASSQTGGTSHNSSMEQEDYPHNLLPSIHRNVEEHQLSYWNEDEKAEICKAAEILIGMKG